MKRCLSWIALAIVLSAAIGVREDAIASPVAFGFTGRVTEVFDGLGALEGRVAPDMPFGGAYVFQSTTPNSAGPGHEGDVGIYHHDKPIAGVAVHVDAMAFLSNFLRPDFDIEVHNDFGFVGSDDYGFESRNNRAIGLRPSAPVDYLNIRWFASTAPMTGTIFDSAELPLDPPSLRELGGGNFVIEGACSMCAGPAAFFRISGTLTSLDKIYPPGDTNGDGVIDRRDIANLVGGLGSLRNPMTGGDVDGDGTVGLVDLSLIQAGLVLPVINSVSAAAVPEPSTLVLAAAAMLGLALAFRARLN